MNIGVRKRFIMLRVFCTVLLIVSSVLNVLAYGNFGSNPPAAHADTIMIGPDPDDENTFKEKFANAPDGTVLDLSNAGDFTVRGNNETWITNNHNITIANGTLNLRYAGILCNGNLTFENVQLNIVSGAGAVIVANGHNLTFNNVTKYTTNYTTNDLTIFGGTVVNSAETIPAAGNWSQTTINVTGKCDLGKIFMGNYDAQKDGTPLASGMADYGKTFSSCTVNIDENCSQYSKSKENRTVYACGGYMAGQNSFVATPNACPMASVRTENAVLNTYDDLILAFDGETGRSNKGTFNFSGSEYAIDNVSLSNLRTLRVKSGKFVAKADTTFAQYMTTLGVESSGFLYAGNLGNKTFTNFEGGGTLNLGKSRTDTSQTLTIADTVSGSTEVEFGNTVGFPYAGVVGVNYIIAPKSGADAFKVSNPTTNQQGYWNRDSSGNWLFSSTKPGEHKHVYGDVYSYDENDHWYQCTDAACPDVEGSKIGIAAHEYEDDQSRKCLDCDYKRVIINDIFSSKDESDKLEVFKARVFNALLHSETSIDVADLNISSSEIKYSVNASNALTGEAAMRFLIINNPFFSGLCISGIPSFTLQDGMVKSVNVVYAITWKEEDISLAQEAYEEAMALVDPNMNAVQELAVIHDWVCEHMTYSMNNQDGDALYALKNGKVVCAGYARCMQFFLDQLGFENVYIDARTPSEQHAWNLVKVDGYWFHIDTTWDDSITGYSHNFFLLNDDEFKGSGDDDGDGVGTHGTDWLDQKKYPANTDAYFANKYWSGVSGKLTESLLSQDPKLTVKKECKHEHTKVETVVPPTCSTKGSGNKVCQDCGETIEVGIELDLDPSNHEDIKEVASVPSTCKVPGKSSYKHCNACNTNVTEPTVLPLDSNNHEHLIDVPALDPTCQTPGYTAHQKCTDCGVEIGKTVLPTVDHRFDDTGHCIWCGKEKEPDPVPSKPEVKQPVVSGDSRGRYAMTCNGVPVTAGQKLEAGSTINFTTYHEAPNYQTGNTIVILKDCSINGVSVMNIDNYRIDTIHGDIRSDRESGGIWANLVNDREVFSYRIPDNSASDINISFEFVEAQVVWRIFNPVTKEHVFTPSREEYEFNRADGWRTGVNWCGEGIGWISPMTGQPVYRLYNESYDRQGYCSHFLTTNRSEAEDPKNVKAGWRYDYEGTPVFYSGGNITIYHARNDAQNLSRLYTSDFNEYWYLGHNSDPAYYGWDLEVDRNLVRDQHGNYVGIFKALK